jgi:transcriptional regulator with XRE-family HTH domain
MGGRIGFIRKKVQSFTFGERIKKIRNERCLSFSEIAKHTGIQVKYLQAFENGDIETLPPLVYTHGFLRAYAKYLGEDPEKFIIFFEREREITQNLISKEIPKNTLRNPLSYKKISFSFRGVAFFGGIVFSIIVLFSLYGEIFHFVTEPTFLLSSPLENMSVYEPFVLVEGKTDVSAKVFLNDQNILVDELGNFSERVDIGNGKNILIFRVVNSFGKETEKIIPIFGQWGEEFQIQKEKKNFFVKALDGENVEFLLQIDGGEIKNESFSRGEKREYNAQNSFVISAQDGSLVQVSLEDEVFAPLTETPKEFVQREFVFQE